MTRSLVVEPMAGALGAQIRGLDLSRLTDAEERRVHELWLEYLVLFFPDQSLRPEAHIELAERFGPPEVHPFLEKLDPSHPQIVVLDSERVPAADVWHTD